MANNYPIQRKEVIIGKQGAETLTASYGDNTGGFIESGGIQAGSAGSDSAGIDNAILLGSLIDGTVDSMVLCVRPIGGSADVDVEGSLTWREIL